MLGLRRHFNNHASGCLPALQASTPQPNPHEIYSARKPSYAYRDLCFHGSPRLKSVRADGRRAFTIERVCSSSAQLSTTAQAHAERTRGTLQHSALTTAATGEGAASSPERACSKSVSLVNALAAGRPRAAEAYRAVARRVIGSARIAPRGVDAAAAVYAHDLVPSQDATRRRRPPLDHA